jgi:hypothetical protein
MSEFYLADAVHASGPLFQTCLFPPPPPPEGHEGKSKAAARPMTRAELDDLRKRNYSVGDVLRVHRHDSESEQHPPFAQKRPREERDRELEDGRPPKVSASGEEEHRRVLALFMQRQREVLEAYQTRPNLLGPE